MQRLEVSGAVRLIYRSLGVKGLTSHIGEREVHLPVLFLFFLEWEAFQTRVAEKV